MAEDPNLIPTERPPKEGEVKPTETPGEEPGNLGRPVEFPNLEGGVTSAGARKKSAGALDALFEEKAGRPPSPEDSKPPADADKPKEKPAPPAEKPAKPAEPPAANPKDAKPADKPADKPAEKPADKPAAKPADAEEVSPEVKKLNEALAGVELGPNAKPKTGEAFGRVKEIARAEVSRVEKERDEIAAKLKEAEERLKKTPELPEETKKELEDLRKWRNSVEVEKDPQWATFDAKISTNNEKIYSRLKDEGMSDEQIQKIKELGGPAKVKWDKLFESMTLPARRFIEGRLIDNENVADEKKDKLAAAKADAEKFVKEREAARTADSGATFKRKREVVDGMIQEADFLKPIEVKADAKPEEKAVAEATNKRVAELKDLIEKGISENTPEMVATLAYGTALAHHYSDLLVVMEKQNESLTKKLQEAEEKLEKIKKASRPTVSELGSRSESRSEPPKAPTSSVRIPGRQALDALMAEKMAEKED